MLKHVRIVTPSCEWKTCIGFTINTLRKNVQKREKIHSTSRIIIINIYAIFIVTRSVQTNCIFWFSSDGGTDQRFLECPRIDQQECSIFNGIIEFVLSIGITAVPHASRIQTNKHTHIGYTHYTVKLAKR